MAAAMESVGTTAYRFVCAGCRALLTENGGLCPACLRSGLIFARYHRPAELLMPPIPSVSASELIRSQASVFNVAACPGLVLGRGAFVFAHGAPGSGKTTQLLQVADCLRPSIFLSLEMGIGPLLASMLRRLEIISPAIVFQEPRSVADIVAAAETPGIRALFIDSLTITTLRPDDVRALARANDICVWGTMQETKGGAFRGSNEWAHAADAILEVADMQWRLTKSRYQPVGIGGSVLA